MPVPVTIVGERSTANGDPRYMRWGSPSLITAGTPGAIAPAGTYESAQVDARGSGKFTLVLVLAGPSTSARSQLRQYDLDGTLLGTDTLNTTMVVPNTVTKDFGDYTTTLAGRVFTVVSVFITNLDGGNALDLAGLYLYSGGGIR